MAGLDAGDELLHPEEGEALRADAVLHGLGAELNTHRARRAGLELEGDARRPDPARPSEPMGRRLPRAGGRARLNG
ncbi:hypothetical protein [Brachybacterium massiliense]|uniref:hypothetical protein n=1 Tax=Brachybacterium massiliense TaxID=1755098 RepID=UPI000B3BB613|nr:hypothetical protein [Brachybacterium massiliense]